ncbi:NAD-dependent succinate-semialdehyde dehydrogenase [Rudaeicoccus suwonensis]|uniref:Succinate-semialdehyde dehydrogenase/glutarate-semialdehyde dehydrogenase n=1 Tax=Rudaeicoccus suwonensis TaxID=657409 RepID=A0A561E2Z4_9MICO|nr:NAD-dependent succinate-semialdehyde dehydrogenase [Rudaeicoccus suwonensis]TWE09987.1 succinate-semialdehyde dehydrogenase/glutarate-semialdehyde dehydrogenase [Rudaeicoccus suwonensis]
MTRQLEALDPGRAILIGGIWRASESTFVVDDPATGRPLTRVANGTSADATAAVNSAATAFGDWRHVPPRERSELLRHAFDLMMRDADEIAGVISAENGKSSADARAEVTYAAEFFRWFSEEAVRGTGAYGVAPSGGARTVVTHHPIGVAALVTPWNFPAAMATRKLAPALAAGCTAVLKPAAETPLTAIKIAHLLEEAGFPPGVVNLVPTTSAAAVVTAWLDDPRVRLLSFTGSTAVGKQLLRQAADRVVVTAMELGGNAPFIVADDADLELAVDAAVVAKLRGGGQACTAANRFYVHASVIDRFAVMLGARFAAHRVGAATDGADIGPLVSARAVAEITRKIDEAVEAGATIAHRSPIPEGSGGYFLGPVVLTDVPADARLIVEETFGPVAPLVSWTDEADLLTQVNASEFGLAAYVFSRDLERALRISEEVEAGMVGVNRGLVSDPSAPFGGVKQSGLGREGGHEGLLEFLQTQYLSVDWAPRST